jgi:2-polyprenyl-3-methyl-5-hydroxy-6-metoxy-1,4-benzoquinol methylase
MTTALCNNCHSIKYEVVHEENKAQYQQIVKCTKCGLMYVYPLKIDINKRYWEGKEKDVSNVEAEPLFSKKMSFMIDQKEQLQVRDFSSSIKHIEKLLPNKGSALEVGPSAGYFLHELEKRGWMVTGIEPSESRRNDAKRIFGYDFIPDKLEDTNLPENNFDVIFMFHVIEHILDPSEFISMLYRYLKPGGILVMETPTYDTLSYKILRHRERSIRFNGHFYFFTKKTLREIACKNNFDVVRHDRVGRTLSLERLCWNLTVMFKSKFIEKAIYKVSSLLRFDKVKIHLNMGDMQRIYCQKRI